MISKINGVILLLLATFVSPLMGQELITQVDKTTVSIDEVFLLLVRAKNIDTNTEPDFSKLTKDFDILSRQLYQQNSIINGRRSSEKSWKLSLKAKREGSISIPVLALEGFKSNTVTMNVTADDNASQIEDQIRFEMKVNKKTAKLNEQVLITLRLTFSTSINIVEFNPLSIAGVELSPLEPKEYQIVDNGISFSVYELRYVLFPKETGVITIPKQKFQAILRQQSNYRNKPQKVVTLYAPAIEVEVSKLPEEVTKNGLMVADDVQLTETWSNENDQITLGDAITRKIILNVSGADRGTLPLVTLPTISGVNVYAEPASINHRENSSGVLIIKEQSFALVPTAAGRIQLPELSIRWWNAQTQRIETTTLPKRTLQIQPKLETKNSLDTELKEEGSRLVKTDVVDRPVNKWLLVINVVLVLIVFLLLFIIYKLRFSVQKVHHVESTNLDLLKRERALFSVVEKQFRQGDIVEIDNAILHWANHCHSLSLLPMAGIKGISLYAADDLIQWFDTVNCYRYGKEEKKVDLDKRILLSLGAARAKILKQSTLHTPSHPAASQSLLSHLYPVKKG